MSATTLLFETDANKIRAGVLDHKRKLILTDEQSKESVWKKGNIYLGKITNIKKGINAVFVDISSNETKLSSDGETKQKHGFLAFDNIAPEYFLKPWSEENGEPDITQLLKVGQKIMVQVKKDQQDHESKGPALTTFISLAGTYLVSLPNSQKQAVSRKADATQRLRVKEIMEQLEINENQGLIVRTAGVNRPLEDLKLDYEALNRQWRLIQSRCEELTAPALIHEEDNILIRNIRDHMGSGVSKIISNNTETYEFIKDYLTYTRPNLLTDDLLELYKHRQPLFEHYGVEEQIEDMFLTSHQLPSAGHLVIQGTEAGVMVDVNSSKSTAGSNIEETALLTNLEAARKTADLLRLRDMGGIIYIDFIDMKEPDNRKKVEQAFLDASQTDKAKIKYEPISELSGCMLVLRQSMGYPFFKSSLEPIENDESIVTGKRRSVASYATHVQHLLTHAAQYDTSIIQVQLPVDVATYILNEGRAKLSSIEQEYQVSIIVIPNENFKTHRCVLKRFREEDQDTHTFDLSHKSLSSHANEKPWHSIKKQQQNLDRVDLKERLGSQQSKAKQSNFIQSIWQALFGSSDDETAAGKQPNTPTSSTKRNNTRTRNHSRNNRRTTDSNKKRESQRTSRTSSTQKQPTSEVDQQPSSSLIEHDNGLGQAAPRQRRTRRTPRGNRSQNSQDSLQHSLNKDSDLLKQIDED